VSVNWPMPPKSTHQFWSTSHVQLFTVQILDNCTYFTSFAHMCQKTCNSNKGIQIRGEVQ